MPHFCIKKLLKPSFLLFFPLLLSGASLDFLINNAINKHTSLQVITHKLDALSDEEALTKNFANPEISLSVSDIQLNDPTNRTLEPMQFSAINFKQKIPYFGKRDALKEKVLAKKRKLFLTLEDAKTSLRETITNKAYSIWQTQEQLRITDEYIKLTRQNIELFTSYNNTDSTSHMGIMNAELSLSQLQIKKSNLKNLLEGLYKQLNYLCETKVDTIELPTQIQKPKNTQHYLKEYQHNTQYKVKLAKLKELQADTKIKELASYIDPVVQVGYYHRQNFEDYINVGVGISLPIYGSEESKKEQSRKMALAQRSDIEDYKNRLTSKIYTLHAQLEDAYRVYTIIQKESLPQIEHMFELSSSAIVSGAELYLYVDMLERKLRLDEQSINAVASYYKTLASLDALTGDTQ